MKKLVYSTKTKSFSEKQFVLLWHQVGTNGDMITHRKSVSSKEEAAEFINKADCEGGDLFDNQEVADKAYRLAQRGNNGDENAREEYLKLINKSIATFSDKFDFESYNSGRKFNTIMEDLDRATQRYDVERVMNQRSFSSDNYDYDSKMLKIAQESLKKAQKSDKPWKNLLIEKAKLNIEYWQKEIVYKKIFNEHQEYISKHRKLMDELEDRIDDERAKLS